MSFMYSEADAGLESLSEIEGYEFLSDLDAGFEEELRSLGVDPASPTAAKRGLGWRGTASGDRAYPAPGAGSYRRGRADLAA